MSSLSMVDPPTFKCVMLGDAFTGKTSYINRHITGRFFDEESGLPLVRVRTLPFNMNNRAVRFKVWDPCHCKPGVKLREAFFKGAKCAIILFDVTSRTTYNSVASWLDDLRRVTPDIPVAVCGNKADKRKYRKINVRTVRYLRRPNIQYMEIAAKCNYNFAGPFVWLAQRLTGDPTLALAVMPTLAPPDIPMTDDVKRIVERELLVAKLMPLPPEDYSDTDVEFDNEDLIEYSTDNEDDF